MTSSFAVCVTIYMLPKKHICFQIIGRPSFRIADYMDDADCTPSGVLKLMNHSEYLFQKDSF